MVHAIKKNQNTAVNLYKAMLRIRKTEEEIAGRYAEQKMRCPTHLSIGQELVGAAVGMVSDHSDYAVSTHRGHAHYLGKGGSVRGMIAEIYGKDGGCARGLGGSMHLIDQSVGFMGSTAIVGNSIPVGVGLGLACQMDRKGAMSYVFLGDGATETGAFYESANFACVKKLPVLFVCENNLYSVYSSLEARQPEGRKIFEMARGLGLHSTHVDGCNAMETYDAMNEMTQHVKSGEGPAFLEISCYRWREHCGPNYDNGLTYGDADPYRSESEFESWKAKDALLLLEKEIQDKSLVTKKDLKAINEDIDREIADGFTFAEESSFPRPDLCASLEFSGDHL